MNMLKNTAKISIIATLTISLLFVGCGKKTTPAESALAHYDLYQKEEITENLPYEESVAKETIKGNRKLSDDYTKTEYKEYKGEIKQEKLDTISTKLAEISKKITPKAEEISQDGDTAVVKLTSKPIDETKYEEILQKKWANLSEEKLEDTDAILTLHIEYYDEIIKNPIFTDKEKSVEIKMIKDSGNWVIDSQKELKKLDKLVFND